MCRDCVPTDLPRRSDEAKPPLSLPLAFTQEKHGCLARKRQLPGHGGDRQRLCLQNHCRRLKSRAGRPRPRCPLTPGLMDGHPGEREVFVTSRPFGLSLLRAPTLTSALSNPSHRGRQDGETTDVTEREEQNVP